jgi:hypothetical protein
MPGAYLLKSSSRALSFKPNTMTNQGVLGQLLQVWIGHGWSGQLGTWTTLHAPAVAFLSKPKATSSSTARDIHELDDS